MGKRHNLKRTLHWFALLAVFSGGALYELRSRSCLLDLANGDFWWHLRSGLGILATHSLPHTGLYSQAAARPWIATSWLYDVWIALGYDIFDVRILLLVAVLFKVLLAVTLFVLGGGLRGRFWKAVTLAVIAQYVLAAVPMLPVFVSMLLFAGELLLLLRWRRTGNAKLLWALPGVFLLWANLHEQFVYGLTALVLMVVVTLIESAVTRTRVAETRVVLLTAAVSLLATFLNPYGWKPYSVFFSDVLSAASTYFADRLALHFRTPPDYVLLLLTMAAFLALGLRRSRDGFQIGLLLLSAAAAFHAQRDAWLVAVVAVGVLGTGETQEHGGVEIRFLSLEVITTGAAVLLALGLIVGVAPMFRRAALNAEIAKAYPADAADFIRTQRLPQPLFNAFPWGGYLTFALPEYPVAIDGRTSLYGDDFNIAYANVMNADEHYSKLTSLNDAGTILLQKNSLMATALASVPGFKTVYSDDVAVVLVRESLP